MTLTGKTALITGGSKGIGRAIALSFAREGASVAISARDERRLGEVAAEVQAIGGKALPIVCDVTNDDDVNRMAETVRESLGPIAILVNSAGIAASHKFIGHPDDLWYQVLDVNLSGVYRVCKAIVPDMVERNWGRIINVASIASKVAGPYLAAYTTSKHGLLGLTRSLAVELNPHNITVNAICPGYVDTPMVTAAIGNLMRRTGRTEAEARQYFESTNPQGRLIDVEEVAMMAVMLAGATARGITGQAINIDGGAVMY